MYISQIFFPIAYSTSKDWIKQYTIDFCTLGYDLYPDFNFWTTTLIPPAKQVITVISLFFTSIGHGS